MNVQVAVLMFASILLAAPLAAEAQPMGQRHRVGLLNAATSGGQSEAVFLEGLRALGYVEGAASRMNREPSNSKSCGPAMTVRK